MLCRAAGTALLHGQTGPHGMLDLSPLSQTSMHAPRTHDGPKITPLSHLVTLKVAISPSAA